MSFLRAGSDHVESQRLGRPAWSSTLMFVAAVAAFTFCFVIGLRNTIRAWRSISWIEEKNADDPRSQSRTPLTFFILLPLLREQKVIEKLIHRMAALDCTGLDVYFVGITTSREQPIQGATTSERLERLMFEHPDRRFVHLHCADGTDTCKADQLNFAMRRLGLLERRADRTFVGVYDADSSPDPRTLQFIAARVHADPALKAIQQVPIYFQNLRDPMNVREALLMARPIHNAYFALTVEVPGMRGQADAISRSPGSWRRVLRTWLSHGLGHGQFFRLDVLTDLGGFQPPSCDTQFGHALAFAGIPLHPHPMLDVGETPESIATLMKQGIVWFNSMNTFWRTKRLIERLDPPNYCRRTAGVMMLRLLHANIAWAAYPLLFAATAVWAVMERQWLLAAYAALAWLVYLGPVFMILRRFDLWSRLCRGFEPVTEPSRASKIALVLIYGVEKLGACVSPWLWMYYAARHWLFGSAVTLQKTERA
jgi:hypothetical protein